MTEKKKTTSFLKVVKIKHLGINLRKQLGGLYNWCYKILLKKERESGMIDTLCLWIERIIIDNMIMLLKVTYRLNISSHYKSLANGCFWRNRKIPQIPMDQYFPICLSPILAVWLGLALSSHSSEPHWIMCTVISLFSHMLDAADTLFYHSVHQWYWTQCVLPTSFPYYGWWIFLRPIVFSRVDLNKAVSKQINK